MNLRKTLMSGVLASSLAFGGALGFAQDATPPADAVDDPDATPVADDVDHLEDLPFVDAQGNVVARAEVWEDEDGEGVWFSIQNEGEAALAEGNYGVHVHEYGVCDPEGDVPFESAGEHFNPTGEEHGDINADPSHAGDLGNLEVDDEGSFEHEVLAEKLTLRSGEQNSLNDENGAVLIIHDSEDDLETDPDGNSGDPWACAILFAAPEEQGTPEATPQQDQEATTPETEDVNGTNGDDTEIEDEADGEVDEEIDPMGGEDGIDDDDAAAPADDDD